MELFFWVTAFFAAFLGNIAAFGISSILLPVSVSVFSFETGLVLTSIFHIFGNVGRVGFFRGRLDRRVFVLFGVPNLVFTGLGASLVGVVPDGLLRALLGVVLVLYAVYGLSMRELRFEPSTVNCVAGGAVYGFFSGLVGSGGPLRGAMLTSFGLTGGVYVATSGGVSFLTDLVRISVYLWRGFLSPGFYGYVPLLFVVALAGSFFSKVAVDRIPRERFRRLIHVAILLAGVRLLLGEVAG